MFLRIEEPPSIDRNRPSLRAFLELGFRPLYLAGAGWAIIAIVLWIFFPQWLRGTLQGVIWHGHEMLWGFIVTIAVGFLMTAGANWTGINPLPGKFLGWICLPWVLARLLYLVPGETVFVAAGFLETLFILGAALAMARAVVKSQSRRNYGVPIVLVGLAVSNLGFLVSVEQGSYEQTLRLFHIGLVLMAMLVLLIGRRVIPFFAMRAIPGMTIPNQMRSSQIQLVLSSLAIIGFALELRTATASLIVVIGGMSIWQVISWKPWVVLRRPILWVLYLGYFLTGVGLMLAAVRLGFSELRAAFSVHVIAMGGFSVLIIGMITRTALGHLGRPLVLSRMTVTAYLLVILATLLRLLALTSTISADAAVRLSAIAWISAFAIYLWEFFPMMIRPRVDIPPVVTINPRRG